jgi:hypothetical protein
MKLFDDARATNDMKKRGDHERSIRHRGRELRRPSASASRSRPSGGEEQSGKRAEEDAGRMDVADAEAVAAAYFFKT